MGKSKNDAPVNLKEDADQGPGELANSDTEQTSTTAAPNEERARDIEPSVDNPYTVEEQTAVDDAVAETAFDTDVHLHSVASAGFQPEDAVVMGVDPAAPDSDHTEVLIDDRTVLPLSRGRVVYYTAGVDDRPNYGQGAMVAHVVEVYSDRRVNLLVAHPLHGDFMRRNDVQFRQPDDEAPDTSYAEWMPFQVAQAQRS